MTPQEVRDIMLRALKHQLAAEVINGDSTAIAKVQVAIQVTQKLSDEQIEEKLVELFTEATEAFNP